MYFLNIFSREVIIFGGPGGGPDNNLITINRFISRLEQGFESLPLRHLFLKSNKPKCEKRNNKRNTMNVVFWALFYGIVNSILKKCFKKYACN